MFFGLEGKLIDVAADAILGDSEWKNEITCALKLGVGAATGDVFLMGQGVNDGLGVLKEHNILGSNPMVDYIAPAALGVLCGGTGTALVAEGAKLLEGWAKSGASDQKPAATSSGPATSTHDAEPATAGDGRDAVGGATTTTATGTKSEEVQLDLAEYVELAKAAGLITESECLAAATSHLQNGAWGKPATNPNMNRELAILLEQKLRTMPELRARFEQAAGVKLEPGKDDKMADGNVPALKPKQVEQTVETQPAEQKPVPDGVGGADVGEVDDEVETEETSTESRPSKATDAHRFDGMSAEEIVETIMNDMMEGLDDELVETAKDLEKAQNKANKGKDQKDGGAAKAQRTADQLTLKLQKLMEKRKAMFEMLSNMSRIYSDMAKAAISNMGRA